MPNYYNPYMIYPQQQINQPAPQQMTQPQIQNGGFVSVRTEDEARNYPVAQGTSITFKNETAPYVYTKTMGFSQLDRPIFERYKLIKEDVPVEVSQSSDKAVMDVEVINTSIDDLKGQIKELWKEIDVLKTSKPTAKRDKTGDD